VPLCFHSAHFLQCISFSNPFFRDVGKNLVVPGGAKVIDAHKKLVIPGNTLISYLLLISTGDLMAVLEIIADHQTLSDQIYQFFSTWNPSI